MEAYENYNHYTMEGCVDYDHNIMEAYENYEHYTIEAT
jgi:hypothetical protein